MRRPLLVLLPLVVIGLATVGCGSSDPSSTTTAATVPAHRLGDAEGARTVRVELSNPTAKVEWRVPGMGPMLLERWDRRTVSVPVTGDSATFPVGYTRVDPSRGVLRVQFSVQLSCETTCVATAEVASNPANLDARATAATRGAPFVTLEVR